MKTRKRTDALPKNSGIGFWQRETLLPFAAALACLLAVAAVLGVRYELNDDAIISNIAAGAYGDGTQYLVYVNVLLGWFLKPFYALAPGLNWFVILLAAGGVLCFTILGRLLLNALGKLGGWAAYAALLALAGADFFHRFHYVRYAGLFLTTGLALVFVSLGRPGGVALWGGVLVLLGSMLRFQQFVSIGGLAAATLLVAFLQLAKPQKLRAVAFVGVLVVLAFALFGVNQLAYAQHPGWENYVQYNALRTEISDFKLQFAAGPETLAPLGYTPTDFEMLQTWNYYDPQVFSQDALREIIALLPGQTAAGAVRQAAGATARLVYGWPVGFLLAAVVLAWLLFSKKGRWAAFAGTLGVLLLQVVYLHWRGRFPTTVAYTLCFAALVFCACCFSPGQVPKTQARGVVLVSLLLLVCALPAFIQMRDAAADYWQSRPPREVALETAMADKNTLYLADVEMVDAANGYNVWRAKPRGYFANIVFTGSWLMHSPFQEEALLAFGVENLFKDSLNRPDVLFVDYTYRALKEDYLQQHYNSSTTLEMVAEGDSVRLYRATASEAG